MEKNVGLVDRIVRVLIGVAIVVGVLAPFVGMLNVGGWGTLWVLGLLPLGLLLGLLLLLTGATGRSLVYRWTGIDTTPGESITEPSPTGETTTEESSGRDEAAGGSTR